MIDRRRLFQLDEDRRPAVDQAPRLGDVFRPLHKGQRDPVDTEIEGETQIGPVFFAQRRNRQHGARHVDAFAVRQAAADQHRGLYPLGRDRLDTQADFAVVEQEFGAGGHGGENFGMRQIYAFARPWRGRKIKVEAAPAG